ncbi:hypothetical protein EAX61_07735 [Dokdonia sinensis]|uniref:DUF4890 domain-containing protein n=1 Tax=Dokdonia sinensis TaxID=2479847 RepID=A0A3M0G4G9_9FLAO|nr:hypothetical protein [Dokdonia sinensis]RMB59468.1 hypothetical protein EAX61_07735 [Dokdonia sinensis]
MKLFWTVLILCFALSSVSAQRMSYTPKDSSSKISKQKIALSLKTPVETYHRALELDEAQEAQVEKLLKKVNGTNESWEQRKKRFDHQLKVILTEKQYARYESLQY